jgi:hypothetical protein
MRPYFPTLEAVAAAEITSLTRWMRFLPTASTEEESAVINAVCKRYHVVKTADPVAAVQASKAVGW